MKKRAVLLAVVIQMGESARPELAGHIENPEQYDTIIPFVTHDLFLLWQIERCI